MADHPVLTEILTAILREESAHASFYRRVARIELKNSPISRKLARFLVKHFYMPVGSGAKAKAETDYAVSTLFSGGEGLEWIDRNVTRKVQTLPGFGGLTEITDQIRRIASA